MSEEKHDRAWTALMAVGILLAFLAAGTLQGCASPQKTAYLTRGTFNTAAADLLAAREADKISAHAFAVVVDAEDAVVPVLDEMDRAAAKSDGFKVWIIGFQVAPKIEALVREAIAAKRKN